MEDTKLYNTHNSLLEPLKCVAQLPANSASLSLQQYIFHGSQKR